MRRPITTVIADVPYYVRAEADAQVCVEVNAATGEVKVGYRKSPDHVWVPAAITDASFETFNAWLEDGDALQRDIDRADDYVDRHIGEAS